MELALQVTSCFSLLLLRFFAGGWCLVCAVGCVAWGMPDLLLTTGGW